MHEDYPIASESAETAPPMVQVSAVSKSFQSPDGTAFQALKGISLNIPAGKFTTLLGPSGCGKTTLLRLIGGFESPDAGVVVIDGRSMDGVPANRRPTNTVFQHYGLFPHMSVARNVAYGLEIAGVARKDAQRRVQQALEMVRLPGFGDRKIAQLSGGQQQRVALARAIVLEPKVLLLDEPMAALDRKLRKEMQTELKRLQNELGIAFLCVTHDQEEALSMSDWVVVMNQGSVEQIGVPEAIYERPRTRFAAKFVGEASLFTAHVSGRSGERATLVTRDGMQLSVAAKGLGESVTLCVRPERWKLVDNAAETDANNSMLCIKGRVTESTYLGGLTQIAAQLPSGESVIAHVPGRYTPGIADLVTLACAPSAVQVLAD
jgi:spermidine/putrescine transport system ATP-binding protein